MTNRLIAISETVHASANAGNKFAILLLKEAKCDCKQCSERSEKPNDEIIHQAYGIILDIGNEVVTAKIEDVIYNFSIQFFDKVKLLIGQPFKYQIRKRKDHTRYFIIVPDNRKIRETKTKKEIKRILKNI